VPICGRNIESRVHEQAVAHGDLVASRQAERHAA